MTTHPLLVLQLAGTQEEMGRQHGELIAQSGGHEATVAYYPTMPTRMLSAGGRSGPELAAVRASRPVLEWALRRLEEERSPELRARTAAFSRALGLSERETRYVAVMDVFQNTVGMLARSGFLGAARRAAAAVPPACSTLAAWGDRTTDGQLLHGRNFDFPGIGIWESQPTVVFCTPSTGLRYGFVTTRGADTPGITAFNEAGLTLSCHTRFHRDVGFGRCIVDLSHDLIRGASTLEQAIQIVRDRRVASTWGLLVSSASEGRAVLIETTAEGVEVSWPGEGEDFLATTNHYQHPALQVDEISISPAWLQHCFGRYAVLRGRALAGGLDADAMRELLGSHLDPEGGGERAAGGVIAQSTTVQSIVSDPGHQRLFVSIGDCPTGRNAFGEVSWQWASTPGVRQVAPQPTAPVDSRYSRAGGALAYAEYVEACRLGEHGASSQELEARLLAAVHHDPTDPTWRFLGGCFRLRHGDAAGALAHFEEGLSHETAGFYRGQLLLWASRAAQECGRADRAHELRRQLLHTTEPLLARHRAHAKGEGRRPPRPGRWRGVPISLELVDAG